MRYGVGRPEIVYPILRAPVPLNMPRRLARLSSSPSEGKANVEPVTLLAALLLGRQDYIVRPHSNYTDHDSKIIKMFTFHINLLICRTT